MIKIALGCFVLINSIALAIIIPEIFFGDFTIKEGLTVILLLNLMIGILAAGIVGGIALINSAF